MSHVLAISASADAQTTPGKLPVSDVALGIHDLEFSIESPGPTAPTGNAVNPVVSNTPTFTITEFANLVQGSAETSDSEGNSRLDFSPGDIGHAERFVDYWGETTRYDIDRGRFMTWQRTHWDTDMADSVAEHRMTIVAKNILKTEVVALRACIQEDGDMYARRAKRVQQEGLRLHNRNTIISSLALVKVQPELKTRTKQYDADPMLFNCLSGVINLQTGQLTPHSAEGMHSRITPLVLAPEGTECPRWMKFLNDIMCGDSDLVSYLQRVVGYIMTGSVREQCFFIFYGGGSNGKSTFINVIYHILAGYAHNVDIRTFEDIDRGNSPRNDLAQLVGMRFVVSPEWKRGQALDEAILKTISGGDLLSARFLNKEMFQFNPVGKIVLASNHKPVVRGTDNGIWRRMRLVPFLAKFEAATEIKDFHKILISEEGPAILRWAMQGAQLWNSHGLKTPATISDATSEYRGSQDWFVTFLQDRCDVQKDASVGSQMLYDDYKTWCVDGGIRLPIKQSDFNERLASNQFEKRITKTGNRWVGLKLKTASPTVGATHNHSSDIFVGNMVHLNHAVCNSPVVGGDLNFGY